MFFNEAYAGMLPLQGSEFARGWDSLYYFLWYLSVAMTLLVMGAMIYFMIRFRKRPGLKTRYITGSHALEIIWTVIPLIIFLSIFAWGYVIYNRMTNSPSDAMEVRVIAKQWLWQFQYDDGKSTVAELYVPVNKPVKLIMTSEDVIHSMFIPNFRIKQDVVPGMYTSVWFEASVPGKHQIFCTEYCGTSHSQMLAKVIALDEQQWKDWQHGKKLGPIPEAGHALTDEDIKAANSGTTLSTVSLAEQGTTIAQTKGCVACHSTDGSKKIGPTWKGIWGKDEELADGSKVKVDENYVRESIETPQAKLVKGYNPVMPTFKGLVNEQEMNAIIAYIKSLK